MNTVHHGGKFHWLFLSEDRKARRFYNLPLQETDNFVVLPSLGSIVPGWLLIVPKTPAARIADLDGAMTGELRDLIGRLRAKNEPSFGKMYLFEHGGYPGSKLSCGVDQAHLHLVPLDFNLVDAALSQDSFSWQKLDGRELPLTLKIDSEYLFVSSFDRSFVRAVQNPVSQWFRKLIADKAGCPEQWDYKAHPFSANIKTTIKNVM